MKTSDRNSILETPLLRIRQPKPQIMAYSAYASTGKRPQPILQTYKNTGLKRVGSKIKEISGHCNQPSMHRNYSQDTDHSYLSVGGPKERKECNSARKNGSFLITQSQTEDDSRITNGFEFSATPDLPNFLDEVSKQIPEIDESSDENVFVEPDSLPATSPKRYGSKGILIVGFLVRVMDGNFNQTKEDANKCKPAPELKNLQPRRSKLHRRATLYVKTTKSQRFGGTPRSNQLSERKCNSFRITSDEPLERKSGKTMFGDTLQIPQITLPGIKSLGKSKSHRSPSDGESIQLSTMNTEDSMESGNETPSCFSHSLVSNSEKLSRGSGNLDSSQQLISRRSFFASNNGNATRDKQSTSPPKVVEELSKEQIKEKKTHLRHFSDLTSSERLGLTSRHHVHKTLQGIESYSKISHLSKTSTRLHQTVRRNFKALIASTDICDESEDFKRLNSSSLEKGTKPIEWHQQKSECLSQCPREKMLRVHRMIKIARATQQQHRSPFGGQDQRMSSMVQGWMKEREKRNQKKSKEIEEEECLSKFVSLHNERERKQRPATVRQSSVI